MALGRGRGNVLCTYVDLLLDFMITVFCPKHSIVPLPDVILLVLSCPVLSKFIVFSDACLFSQG